MTRKRKRVRVHLADPHPESNLPSIEGLLIAKGKEYVIAIPKLLLAQGANPAELEARYVVIPRERIAFYEILA